MKWQSGQVIITPERAGGRVEPGPEVGASIGQAARQANCAAGAGDNEKGE